MKPSHDIYRIQFKDFTLNEDQFDHPSQLHGVMHTYRVMVNVLRLGLITGHTREARLAYFAAYIHDMARKHDGYCTQHGADAANLKLPLYQKLFQLNGASSKDLLTIGKAVTFHSLGSELPDNDPDWLTVALLKDADAIDRIRLGTADLNPAFLRLPQTHQCILFARALFYQTSDFKPPDFETMLKKSTKILQY